MTMVQQAATAVEAARAVLADLDSLSRAPLDEVVDLLSQTAALARIVEAQQVRLAGEIAERSRVPDDTSICRRLGHRSPKEAVASAFGIRAREASSLLTLAAATRPAMGITGADIPIRYPQVAAALDAGDISFAQAQAIVEQLEPAAPRAEVEQLAWAETQLVAAATDPEAPLVPELLVTQARVYVAVLDPDGVLPNAERQRAMRSLRLSQRPDGVWCMTMLSPPEDGSALKALLDSYTSPRVKVAFRDADADADAAGAGDAGLDGDAGRQVDPDGMPSADGIGIVDDRTPEQKRHDVLVALVRAHAASGDAPVAGGEPPVLVFTGTIEAYDAYRRGIDSPDRALTIEHTGNIVPIETVDRLACDASIHHAIVNGAGHVLSLGSAERLFNRAQRRALAARDKGCRVPGCGMPVAWCEAHHVVPWQLGGPTDVDNGILLCNYHHHEVHAGRLTIERAGPEVGRWRVVPALRPADRFGRNRRLATALPGGDALVDSRGAHVRAADAGPALAVLLPDPPSTSTGASSQAHPRPASATPAAPATRPPRRGARTVEARLRHRLRSRRRAPALPIAALDLGRPAHIVMRT
ncbi:HNH endonuclease signature motif containing protein [Agrococcus beijingensis]|uniref:HNH endonuclease signature motif containing protein n=1 Tax=Agrococcus beijingensis TaxID=3068634 RepID=UPI0027408796|nr:HNH endonuclease signature motif containing protein [Agrococcus sp. REN33]